MKYIFFKPLIEWFGYTRRERRSSFILLLLIVTVIVSRFIIPERDIKVDILATIPIESASDTNPARKITAGRYKSDMKKRVSQTQKVLDINSCDSASLEALPGIGPVLSARIIRYRNLLGGYASVKQLREVYGLPEETFNIVSGMLTADSSDVTRININDADYNKMIRLPYFNRYEVLSILKYREFKGRVDCMQELVDEKILTPEKAEKVRCYLEFDRSKSSLQHGEF